MSVGRTVSDPPDDPVTGLRAAAAELDVAYTATLARIEREYPGVDPYQVPDLDGRPVLLNAAAARVMARAALVLAETAHL
jgi:hypothetical protein